MGKSVYLAAAVITSVLFVATFFMVVRQDESTINRLYDELSDVYEEQQALKILASYSEEIDEETCIVYEKQISRQLERIYGLFEELELLKGAQMTVSDEKIRRRYLLTNMSLWLDVQKVQKDCRFRMKPLLYFFSNEPVCTPCLAVQDQLEVIKRSCPEVRVFAFPESSSDFEFVSLLKKDYDVNTAPALVIKGKTFSGVTDTTTIKKELGCS